MGTLTANAGVGVYVEGTSYLVGMWAGRGSTGKHTSWHWGTSTDTTAIGLAKDACEAASQGQPGDFRGELPTAGQDWFDDLSSNWQARVEAAAADAYDRGYKW